MPSLGVSTTAMPGIHEPVSTRELQMATAAQESHAPDQDHIRGLDGLRGVAVMMVMALHVCKANNHTPSHVVNFIYGVIHSGWVGVDLFFVLSGFLITRILFRTQHDSHYLRNFYARRFLRIFPLYYGAIAVLVLLEPVLHLHLWRALPYYLSYTANLRATGPIRFPDVPGNAWVISHFWSLQIEEQFYLVWPFALAILRTRRNIVLGAFIGSIGALAMRCYFVADAARYTNEYWAYAFTPCRIDALLIGSALAILWSTRARAMLIRTAPTMFAAFATILVGFGLWRREFDPTDNRFVLTIGFTVVALAAAALIILVMSRKTVGQIFEHRVLCWLGKYSYGIYVLHFIWNYFLSEPLRRGVVTATNSKALGVAIPALTIMGISILSAYASFELFEKRMLRLKHHFEYEDTQRGLSSTAADNDAGLSPAALDSAAALQVVWPAQ